MRKAGLTAIAVAFSWLGLFGLVETAKADHGYETLEVNECEAFQRVLAANDQLYLCRTNVVELSHASSSDDLGTAGVFLVLEESGSPVEIVTIPRVDYGLAAIYFSGTDVTAPTFDTTTVDVYITESPSYFPSPVSGTPIEITFNVSTSYEDTQELLTITLPRMMLRLEFDDPDIALGTLIEGGGITTEGRVYVEEAFEILVNLVPEAFVFSPTTETGEPTGSADVPTYIEALQEVGRNSFFTKGALSWGKLIGIKSLVTIALMGNVITLALILAIFYVINKRFGFPVNFKATYFALPSCLFIDAYMGAIGFDVFIMFIGLVWIIGFGMFMNRHMPN